MASRFLPSFQLMVPLLTVLIVLMTGWSGMAAPALPALGAPAVPLGSPAQAAGSLIAPAAAPAAGHGAYPYLGPGLILLGAVSLMDQGLYDAVHAVPDPGRRAFFGTVTHLGDGLTALALAIGLRAYDPETAAYVGRAALRAGVATTVLKLAVTRARPSENPGSCGGGLSVSRCASFPSGHSATAFSVARVLAHQYPDYQWLFYGLAALAAWSRVEVEAHWPSDIVAGALIGLWAADSVLRQTDDVAPRGDL